MEFEFQIPNGLGVLGEEAEGGPHHLDTLIPSVVEFAPELLEPRRE